LALAAFGDDRGKRYNPAIERTSSASRSPARGGVGGSHASRTAAACPLAA